MNVDELARIDDLGIAAWDKHDPDAFISLFADGFTWTDATTPAPITTPDDARAHMASWFTAFPDMHVTETRRVIGEDCVAAELEFTGTNTGTLDMGGNQIPPTGKSIVGHGTYFAEVQDGKIVVFSSHPDVAGMMMQLGLMGPQ